MTPLQVNQTPTAPPPPGDLQEIFTTAANWPVPKHFSSVAQAAEFVLILLAAARTFDALRTEQDALDILKTPSANANVKGALSDKELCQRGLRLLKKITEKLGSIEDSLSKLRQSTKPQVRSNDQGGSNSEQNSTDVIRDYRDWFHEWINLLKSIPADNTSRSCTPLNWTFGFPTFLLELPCSIKIGSEMG
ncbi:hypothetical protein C8J56DRAFT_881380 [Mycena floridula]|nr:hypothetical protein C8J56DRAFT_881380 [Mycena floridula]